MKFEVYTVDADKAKEYSYQMGEVRVRFPEYGEDYCTSKDDKGELYFPVPNAFTDTAGRTYIGRIKDAYDTVLNGDGDVIQVSHLFGMTMISVAKFVNYDYGKEMRKKFLEGWKDTQFGWGLEAGNAHSTSGFTAVCEDMATYNRYLSPEKNSPTLYFETEIEAQAKMDEIVRICQSYIDRCKDAPDSDSQKAILDEIEQKFGLFSVYLNYVFAKLSSEGESDYRFRVVQRVK